MYFTHILNFKINIVGIFIYNFILKFNLLLYVIILYIVILNKLIKIS